MVLDEKIQIKHTVHGLRADFKVDGLLKCIALRAFSDVPVSTQVTLSTANGDKSVVYHKMGDRWLALNPNPGPFEKAYEPDSYVANVLNSLLETS